jgi:hypothetical protein
MQSIKVGWRMPEASNSNTLGCAAEQQKQVTVSLVSEEGPEVAVEGIDSFIRPSPPYTEKWANIFTDRKDARYALHTMRHCRNELP